MNRQEVVMGRSVYQALGALLLAPAIAVAQSASAPALREACLPPSIPPPGFGGGGTRQVTVVELPEPSVAVITRSPGSVMCQTRLNRPAQALLTPLVKDHGPPRSSEPPQPATPSPNVSTMASVKPGLDVSPRHA